MKRLLSAIVIASALLAPCASAQTVETLQKKQLEFEIIKKQFNETAQHVFSNLKKIAQALANKKLFRPTNGVKTIIEAQSIKDLKTTAKTLSDAINDINRRLKYIQDSDLATIDVLKDLSIQNKAALKDFLSKQTDALTAVKEDYKTLITEIVQIIERDIIAHVQKKKQFKKLVKQLTSCTDIALLNKAQALVQDVITVFGTTDNSKQQEIVVLPFDQFKEKLDQMLENLNEKTPDQAITQTLTQLMAHGRKSCDFNQKLEYLIQMGSDSNIHNLFETLVKTELSKETITPLIKHIATPDELRNMLFAQIEISFGSFEMQKDFATLHPLFQHVTQFYTANKQVGAIMLDEIARRLAHYPFTINTPFVSETQTFEKKVTQLIDLASSLETEEDVKMLFLEKLFYRIIERLFVLSKDTCNIENGRVIICIKEAIDTLLQQAKDFKTAINSEKAEMIQALYEIQRDAIKTLVWLKTTKEEITPKKLRQKFSCFHEEETWKMDIYLQIQQDNSDEEKILLRPGGYEGQAVEKAEQSCFIYPTTLQTRVIVNVSDMIQEIEEKYKTKELQPDERKPWKALETTIQKIIPGFKVETEMRKDLQTDIKRFNQWIMLCDGLCSKDMLKRKNGIIPGGDVIVKRIRNNAQKIRTQHFNQNPDLLESVKSAIARINNQLTAMNIGDINLAITMIISDLEAIDRKLQNALYS